MLIHAHTWYQSYTIHLLTKTISFLFLFKTFLFKIGGKISTDVNKETKEEKKKRKKKTEIVKQSATVNKEKEGQEKIENYDFLDDTNLLKKRKSENIENIDSIERKKKKESNEIGDNLQFDAPKNTDFEKNVRELKRVSTDTGAAERTTLASLPSDRQTPVLECLRGRLVNIERSCKYWSTYALLKTWYLSSRQSFSNYSYDK